MCSKTHFSGLHLTFFGKQAQKIHLKWGLASFELQNDAKKTEKILPAAITLFKLERHFR